MKFTVSSSALSGHIQAISKVIAPKNTLPILDNFLFNISDNRLELTASDTETTMVTAVDLIDSDQNYTFAISAKNMIDALKEISEQPITIEVNPATMEVSIFYQNGVFKFMAVKADEYPHMKPLNGKAGDLTISASALQKGITSTIFASADDELRPVMNGVVLDITSQDVTFVASDAHKLVRLKNSAFSDPSMPEGTNAKLILRKKPLSILKGLLPKESGDVRIVFDDNRCLIQFADFTMSTLLIEGRFPNYNAVIPQNNPYTVWIDRLSLLTALKRVSICTDQSNGLIKIEIADNRLKISAQNTDFSTSAEESVPCQYGDEAIKIGFKAQFLMDILSNLSTDDVVIKLADAARAGLIMPSQNEDGEDLLMLLMPMMIKA